MSNDIYTREDLAKGLSRQMAESKAASRRSVDLFFDALADALNHHRAVHIRGFGRFEVVDTPERQGRNPKTGDPAVIPAGRRVKFKASKSLLEPTS